MPHHHVTDAPLPCHLGQIFVTLNVTHILISKIKDSIWFSTRKENRVCASMLNILMRCLPDHWSFICIKQFYMQTFHGYLHFCQVEEVKNRQSELVECYQIASGDWEIYVLSYPWLRYIMSWHFSSSNSCRYGMNASCCRAKTLVQYFGEEFNYEKCHKYVMIAFMLCYHVWFLSKYVAKSMRPVLKCTKG